MKKIISILLAVTMVFSITTVCAFAADADIPGEINGVICEVNAEIDNTLGDISTLISDHAAVANEKLNELGNKIVFDSGLNSFLARIDDLVESFISSIIRILGDLGINVGE